MRRSGKVPPLESNSKLQNGKKGLNELIKQKEEKRDEKDIILVQDT